MLRLQSGILAKKLPLTEWSSFGITDLLIDRSLFAPETYLNHKVTNSPKFVFSRSDFGHSRKQLAKWDEDGKAAEGIANQLLAGNFPYLGRKVIKTSFPPDWFLDPSSKERVPNDLHWSRYGDFDHGDVKLIWELSRFGFVYALVRAYVRTRNDKYAEAFWHLLEDWRDKNPPQQGPNWKCGQEISFRIMALCFGLYAFIESSATTPERLVKLVEMIAVFGHRIEHNLEYGLNQRNNHSISEGLGLWTIGVLFPELKRAAFWEKKGRSILEDCATELIYEDGSFVQQSVNYHRLMLHAYLWVIRLGDLNGAPFSGVLKERIKKAGEFLFQIQDGSTGRVPLYGENDGALILPLNNCDYLDFRPVIQCINYLSTGSRCYQPGPWDEDLLWLFGSEALNAPVEQPTHKNWQAEVSGYYTLRSDKGFLFTRCGAHNDRPLSADMLHVDVWWRGQNIALDAGTYSYNASPPWNHALNGTAFHNTVSVDGCDQMERFSKFIWVPWVNGSVRSRLTSEFQHLDYFEGQHDGYERLSAAVGYRRGILQFAEEHWLVLDHLTSATNHGYRLHWLLKDLPYDWDENRGSLILNTEAGDYKVQTGLAAGKTDFSLVRADPRSPRGWRAPAYNYREPALSLASQSEGKSILFWTVLGPQDWNVQLDQGLLSVNGHKWKLQVQIEPSAPSLISTASLSGDYVDHLRID